MAGIWVGGRELVTLGKMISDARGEPITILTWGDTHTPHADHASTLAQEVKEGQPSVILLPASIDATVLGARLAQLLECPMVSDCLTARYLPAEECLEMERFIYGGGAVLVVQNRTWPIVITMSPSAFGKETDEAPEISCSTKHIAPSPSTLQIVERKAKMGTTRPITEARVIVGVGRGLKRKEDLSLVRNLAEAIGAEIGCTRPLAEELHWLPESACIGLSGAQVKPDLYLALGISGQIQHVTGIRQARVIVAVNRDGKAPIFETSDFGIVGDLYEFIPLYLAALTGHG